MHPADRAGSSRQLPDLRHGAGAEEAVAGGRRGKSELRDMTRRFWIGAALSLPVLHPRDGAHLPVRAALGGRAMSRWTQFILSTPVVLWAGWPFFQRGWQSIVNRSLNMFTLIAIGVGRGLFLQRCRDALAADLSRRPSRRTARSAFILKRPRSSPSWSCSARCSSCARAAAPEARFARCSISRRRPRASSRDGAEHGCAARGSADGGSTAGAAGRKGSRRRPRHRWPNERSMNR